MEECQGSGLSQAEFCRQRGIRRRSLSFWKWKLSREAGAGAPAAAGPAGPPRQRAFVPVRVVAPRRRSGEPPTGAAPAWASEIEIVLAAGRLVRVRGRVDPEGLGQVLRALEAARC
jgi:hypothetical protein